MNKEKLLKFAKSLGLSKVSGAKRAGWVISRCPMAKWTHEKGTDTEPAFGMKIGKTFCYCFACNFSGDLEDLLMQLAVRTKGNKEAAKYILAARHYLDTEGKTTLSIGKVEDEEEIDEIIEWPEWYIAGYLPAYKHPYLATRKGGPVPPEVAKIMDFRLDAKRHRIGTPIRDFSGALMGFHGRTVNGHNLSYLAYTYGTGGDKHWNKPIWLGEHWLDLSKPVLIVESMFDLARALQVYRNSICPLMAGMPKSKIQRLSQCLEIVAMFDNDKAGAIAEKKLKAELPDTNIITPGLPAGYGDVGDMEADVLAARLAPYLDLDQMLD